MAIQMSCISQPIFSCILYKFAFAAMQDDGGDEVGGCALCYQRTASLSGECNENYCAECRPTHLWGQNCLHTMHVTCVEPVDVNLGLKSGYLVQKQHTRCTGHTLDKLSL